MRSASAWLVACAAVGIAPLTAYGQGSNLGSYGAQFAPGRIAGRVTNSGTPVAGARVETTAGQFAVTDADGRYLIYVDATGIYDVKVTTASRIAGPLPASVAPGATTTLDFTSWRVRQRPRRNLPPPPPLPPGGRP
jgi:hypothetical protein